MKKTYFLWSLLGLFCLHLGWAQQKTITGTVNDDDGFPLPGATVVVEGSNRGVATDFDGNFSIETQEGETLLITYIGYSDYQLVVGSQDSYTISLSPDIELEEVVVTSLGIRREAKALGYSVQKVSGDEISRSGSNNALDALVGKAAGVQITRSSGSAGGGSRILIRGVTSFVGDNQPLIVIDGVRTNNETLNPGASTAGTDQSNRLQDLNNDDIESINILKGSAATALYGTSGAPGVIVITTKKGTKSPMQVSYSTQVGVDMLSTTINLQNEFAQGSSGRYRDSSTGNSGSWGPRISELEFSNTRGFDEVPDTIDIGSSAFNAEGVYIYDKNGYLVPRGTGNGKAANLYDNVRPFFRDALSTLNSLSINGGGDVATYHFSTSFLSNEGIVPNEKYGRKTFNLSSSIKANERLNFKTTMNFIRSDYDRIQQGSNTSGLLLGMYRTPISFDNANGFSHEEAVNQPSSYIFPNGNQRNYRGGGG